MSPKNSRHPRQRHSRLAGEKGAHMRVRRQAFDMARGIAKRDSLNQHALAFTLNTARTRASALIHGHVHRFNTESLIDILARLGVTVELTVTRVQRYAVGYNPRPRPGWKPPPDMVIG